ncbi:MAG TPA: DUF2344 domain-containing protein [Clostridiaceae bacterium]|nr:DUF2344 domain-containing protein [Clostridiaceae bacterium]
MNGLRIKFLRGEEVKYISHLDLMKVFERALRRARLPVAYSQGFNPHPEMIFGLPLSVGVTSEAEYADFGLEGNVSPADFMRRLNAQLPAGLKVLEAKKKFAKDNIMASITMASYRITVSAEGHFDREFLQEKINDFIERPTIIVKKETKSKVRDVDIKPMIHQLCLGDSEEGTFTVNSLLSAGSSANLKPELLYDAFADTFGPGIKLKAIHRTGLFVSRNGVMVDPMDDRVLEGTNPKR